MLRSFSKNAATVYGGASSIDAIISSLDMIHVP